MEKIDRANSWAAPKLIAHRGLAVGCPPSSMGAFRRAGEAGFWAIETDIRKTKDGRYVCIHDADTFGVLEGGGAVAELTLEELRKLRYRDNDETAEGPIPTLEEYLEVCRQHGCCPFLETKTADVAQVLEIAFRYFREEEVILSSIDFAHIRMAAEVSGKVFLHHIFSDREKMYWLAERGYGGVSFKVRDSSEAPRELLEKTHSLGLCYCLRAADSLENFEKMLAIGADYVPTNCLLPGTVKGFAGAGIPMQDGEAGKEKTL